MAQSGRSWGSGSGSGSWGGRRKKVYDYLKAANELRQNYTTQLGNSIREISSDEYTDVPGAYPDVDSAQSGGEQLVLFPNYAKRIIKKDAKQRASELEAYRHRGYLTGGFDDEESSYYGRDDEWADSGYRSDEDENAIVKVNVHGWVYVPHRGQMGRKQRLMVALARKLSGIPVPNSNNNNIMGPPDKIGGTSDEEVVNKQAQLILNETGKGKGQTRSEDSLEGIDDRKPAGAIVQRSSTAPPSSQSSQMTHDELIAANANLLERLRPFLAHPMADLPVSVFFFNDEQSQQRTAYTDELGHFSIRTALHFVPTHIRVLASDGMSTAKEVRVIEPTGVSLISDIDDTVKHSGIALGAKEICRNTFVRDLNELVVDGVGQWYGKLASMGVQLHYVSNSPWQIYALLEKFFKLAGLPAGSLHLKQYSGMLQGLFESAAEKKKGSLERILQDFPERKFIFVGDSGEADLEVYTEIALTHPGRVLGIFIRDVTTPDQKPLERPANHLQAAPSRSQSNGCVVGHSSTVAVEKPPALPPRKPRVEPSDPTNDLDNADLIDLRDKQDQKEPQRKTTEVVSQPRPPAKPLKPSSLRTATMASDSPGPEESSPTQKQNAVRRKPLPPPRRHTGSATQMEPNQESPGTSLSKQNGGSTPSGKNSLTSVSSLSTEQLPARPKPQYSETSRTGRSLKPPPVPPPRRSNTGIPTSPSSTTTSSNSSPTRPVSQQPSLKQSYPTAAASAAYQYASDRLSRVSSSSSLPTISHQPVRRPNTSSSFNGDNQTPASLPSSMPNRREEMWRRRWKGAKDVLDDQGVILGSWRVGGDVQEVCVWLAQEAMKDINNSQGKS